MNAEHFIKLHKAEGNAAEETAIKQMVAADLQSMAANGAALKAHREAAGQVAVVCKCGAESVLDAKRPEKAPKAKCGICGEALAA